MAEEEPVTDFEAFCESKADDPIVLAICDANDLTLTTQVGLNRFFLLFGVSAQNLMCCLVLVFL